MISKRVGPIKIEIKKGTRTRQMRTALPIMSPIDEGDLLTEVSKLSPPVSHIPGNELKFEILESISIQRDP